MYTENPRWCSSRGPYYLRPEVWLPQSWSNFTDWCDTNLVGRVVLSSRARGNVRSPRFEDVEACGGVVSYGWQCTIAMRRMGNGEGNL